MKIKIGKNELIFGIVDIDLDSEVIYPISFSIEEFKIQGNKAILTYSPNVHEQFGIEEIEILEGTEEEIEMFNKFLKKN